jgi:hypothetical protein
MADVKAVKSIYTGADVTSLGEVAAADNVALPGSQSIASLTASKPVFTDSNKKLVSTGTTPLDQGGTGQTTKSAAFDALSPMDAIGQVIYGGASGTGTKLAAGSDGQVLVSNGAAAPGWEYRPLINLLTNSQWMAMSGSTLCEVTSGAAPVTDGANAALVNNLITNGGFDSDETGWVGTNASLTSAAGGKTGNCLSVAESGGVSYGYAKQSVTTVIGKLYAFSAYFKKGTADKGQISVGSTLLGGQYYSSGNLSDADWTIHSVVFEATTTTTYVGLITNDPTAGETSLFDSVTLYEVTPGYVAASPSVLGPDGWSKNYGGVAPFVYREHTGTNTKDGSFYALSVIAKESNNASGLFWPSTYNDSVLLKKVASRTVTVGCWVKTDTANCAKLSIYEGTSYPSSYHTGGGGWEWLEVSATVRTAPAAFWVQLHCIVDTKTAYFSQPMLVFGSSIGQGNYQPIPNEVIWFNNALVTLESGATITASISKNMEAWSSGQAGKGIKAAYFVFQVINSAAPKNFSIYDAASPLSFISCVTQVAAQAISGNGWVRADANGDFYLYFADGGFSDITIRTMAIQT